MVDQKHVFGSIDTEAKLGCLKEYLQAYSIALKNKGFARIYIDAFAGTGSRTVTRASLPMLAGEQTDPVEVNTPGSARIALNIRPEFHSIILIEKDPQKAEALGQLSREFGRQIHIYNDDANAVVQRLCSRYDWHREKMRGVIFLDPFGMEVSWETVTAIANTKALDCWYFFPLSGLYRNAPHDPNKLDDSKINSLNRVFGTDKWRSDWYDIDNKQQDLFIESVKEERVYNPDRIEQWVKQRLESIFEGKVLDPLRLRHANRTPMASLFFAVSNPHRQAVKLATEIAGHILRAGRSSQIRSR